MGSRKKVNLKKTKIIMSIDDYDRNKNKFQNLSERCLNPVKEELNPNLNPIEVNDRFASNLSEDLQYSFNKSENSEVDLQNILQGKKKETIDSLEFLFSFCKFLSSFEESEEFLKVLRLFSLLYDDISSGKSVFSATSFLSRWNELYDPITQCEIDSLVNKLLMKQIRVIKKGVNIEFTHIGEEIWKWTKEILAFQTRKFQMGLLAPIFEAEHDFNHYQLFQQENIDADLIKSYLISLNRVIKVFEEKLSEFVLGRRAIPMLEKLKNQYEILKNESKFKFMDASLRDKVLDTQLHAITLGFKVIGRTAEFENKSIESGDRALLYNMMIDEIVKELKDEGKSNYFEQFNEDIIYFPLQIPFEINDYKIEQSICKVIDSEYLSPDEMPDIELIDPTFETIEELPQQKVDALDHRIQFIYSSLCIDEIKLESDIVIKKNLSESVWNVFAVSMLIKSGDIEYTIDSLRRINRFGIRLFTDGLLQRISKNNFYLQTELVEK